MKMKKEITSEKLHKAFASSERESQNSEIVKVIYRAFRSGETDNVAKLVVPDLEWWYHGPPDCHHMMKMLTGESTKAVFKFRPRRIRVIGNHTVVAEGWEGMEGYWVHLWSLMDGVVIQLREYFNTSLTILLRISEDGEEARLWQSAPQVRRRKSLPDLVIAL